MIGSSDGDAASTPTLGVSSLTVAPSSAASRGDVASGNCMPSNEIRSQASYARAAGLRERGAEPADREHPAAAR